ncbi:MAG TPA: hypothetical protein VHD87_12885 [Acidimicrobiales bacterium]|nr:hypothetical protein [Acidimicrobiales bacterium]
MSTDRSTMRRATQIISALAVAAAGALTVGAVVAAPGHNAETRRVASRASHAATTLPPVVTAPATTAPPATVVSTSTTAAGVTAADASCPLGGVVLEQPTATSPEPAGYEVQYRVEVGVLNQSNTAVEVTPMMLTVGTAAIPDLGSRVKPAGHSTLAPRELDRQVVIVPWTPARGPLASLGLVTAPTARWAPGAGVSAACAPPPVDTTALRLGLA